MMQLIWLLIDPLIDLVIQLIGPIVKIGAVIIFVLFLDTHFQLGLSKWFIDFMVANFTNVWLRNIFGWNI